MPEPASMILLGGGLMGMLFRFTKKCFQQTKRILDIFLSCVFILILAPLCIILAVLIKVSSNGPVFFSQTRVGKEGRLFTMYKFRSMRLDAESISGPVWAKSDDPRVTGIGKFMRKTHLDEIPQFLNVLKGDMSIIGPRPERPHFVDKLKSEIPEYQKRLAVLPGITGLAQVKYKYDESVDDVKNKLQYDLEYIKSLQEKSWINEFKIMFGTLILMITGKNKFI